MGAVFVSYRRDDSEGQARALALTLAKHVGKDSVFMDVDSIALGRDFRQVLNDHLASCDLMLVLIGKKWLDVKDTSGNRRLEDPIDYVRQEIAAALKRNIPVTPVLLQGVPMPPSDRLPDDIKDLVYRNSFELGHSRWESDVDEMVRRLGIVRSYGRYWAGGLATATFCLFLAVRTFWINYPGASATDGNGQSPPNAIRDERDTQPPERPGSSFILGTGSRVPCTSPRLIRLRPPAMAEWRLTLRSRQNNPYHPSK